MKLTFRSRHKSIRELPETTLPSFVLLTGVNGAGKTHLLQALESGAIEVDVAPDPKSDLRYLDWSSLVPGDSKQISTHSLYAERDNILQKSRESRTRLEADMGAILAEPALRTWILDGWELALLSDADYQARFGTTEEAAKILRRVRQVVDKASQRVLQEFNNTPRLKSLAARVSTENGVPVALLDFQHFNARHISWGHVDLFQQSFAQLFLAYFEQQKLNALYRLEQEAGREPSQPPLGESEFIERHGRPPWDFVNDTLVRAGLDFQIDQPIGWERTTYSPQLTKRSSAVPVPFSALSSGEKILMSFALCLYNSTDHRQDVRRPKLLLLDEVDAPLHPSMSRRLIDTVTETLIKKEGLNVIMTTHSPSTVAVSPEEAVYTMSPNAIGISKTSKSHALALLTSEIPTLSISFDGRRQVFVESDTDAELLGAVYQQLRPSLKSERSLVFIGAGRRPPSGADVNGGSAQVTKVVGQLVQGGNASVFGLLDWDTSRISQERIHVLAEGERYSIENCLLDPLLLASAAVRIDPGEGNLLEDGETYLSIPSFPLDRLQGMADKLQRTILGLAPNATLPRRRSVNYTGEFSLELSDEYLRKNGHKLEEIAHQQLPSLRYFHQPGSLLKHIASVIVTEVPRLVPLVFRDGFFKLLSA